MNMFSKSIVVLVFFLTMGVVTSDGYAAEKLDLKLRLKPGQKHSMRIITENKISHTIMGQQQKINHHKAIELDFEVKKVESNGTASVKVTYRSLKEKGESDYGKMEYDSAKPETSAGNPMAPTYNAMVGQSFLMKIVSNGKVVELKGIDKMYERMAERIVEAEDKLLSKRKKKFKSIQDTVKRAVKKRSKRERRETAKEMIKTNPIFAEERFKETVANVFVLLPSSPVGAGDSWRDKMMLGALSGLVEADSTYTLKKIEKEVVIVDVSSKKDLDNEAVSLGTGSMKGSCSYQQSCEVDKATGWLKRNKAKTQFSGEITTQGKTVPTSIERLVTVELIEVLTAK
ncbi:MAG: DUF6263 family protein [Planctomycetota bacterium]|jgi:hypothetical protein